MLATSQNLCLGKRTAPAKFQFEENDDLDQYPCELQDRSFDLDYKGLIVDEINFFDDLNLDNQDSLCGNEAFEDSMSFRIKSDFSEMRSLSDLGVDITYAEEKFDFTQEQKVWHEYPGDFKETASKYNNSLNDKMKTQLEEVNDLLNKMASIVVKLEPKKARFIVDSRAENSNTMKKQLAKLNKKLAAANASKNRKIDFETDSIGTEINSYIKQNSFSSISTAASKKLKIK